MKARCSDYPVGQALLAAIFHSGLGCREFFLAIGYRNLSKAMRALDDWLQQGEGSMTLIERLQASRFTIPADEFVAVWAANQFMVDTRKLRQAQEAEERARADFVPLLEVIAERPYPDTGVTIFIIVGGNSRYNILLPLDIADWPEEAQLAHVRQLIRESYARHGGRTFCTGAICGYWYRAAFDAPPLRLTVDGLPEPVGDSSDKRHPVPGTGRARLMGGKDVTALLQSIAPPPDAHLVAGEDGQMMGITKH